MKNKETIEEFLNKTYKIRDELKNDYRFAVLMECLAIISLIVSIIKWQNNGWLFVFVLLAFLFCVVFGFMLFRGFKLLKRTTAVIIALEHEVRADE